MSASQTGQLLIDQSTIHYTTQGHGPRVVICLHGYGESARSFDWLMQLFSPADYSFFAIDFPFHGSTTWKEGNEFTPAQLLNVVQQLRERHFPAQASFTLLGYSMGGRVALSLTELIPEQINRLILLAPDGLTVNFWYWLATQTWWGNRLFYYTMHHPGWFITLLKAGRILGLVNRSVHKFTRQAIKDKAFRLSLYERWTTMRHFRPSLPGIKVIIRSWQLPVELVYGQYDRIIVSSKGKKFRKGIEKYCRLHLVETGHQVMQEKAAALLRSLLPAE